MMIFFVCALVIGQNVPLTSMELKYNEYNGLMYLFIRFHEFP